MIEQLITLILKKAEEKRISAGYAGEYGDRGASNMIDQVKFYNYGRQGVIPPEWNHYTEELDPEYQEYQRLKSKFGGR